MKSVLFQNTTKQQGLFLFLNLSTLTFFSNKLFSLYIFHSFEQKHQIQESDYGSWKISRHSKVQNKVIEIEETLQQGGKEWEYESGDKEQKSKKAYWRNSQNCWFTKDKIFQLLILVSIYLNLNHVSKYVTNLLRFLSYFCM